MLKLINWSLSFQLFNKIHVTHIFAYEIMCARGGEGGGEKERRRELSRIITKQTIHHSKEKVPFCIRENQSNENSRI